MSNLILPVSSFVSTTAQPPFLSNGALGLQPCLEPIPPACPAPAPIEVTASPAAILPEVATLPTLAAEPPVAAHATHCIVKGCVFPALVEGNPECHYHRLLRTDAVLFQSHQPSHLLLERAPLDLPEEEIDDSRFQDRKRLAAEREEFVLDEPLEQS